MIKVLVTSCKLRIYCGNNQGEIFVYKIKNLKKAFKNGDSQAKLKLVDLIITKDDTVIRDLYRQAEFTVVTSENNKIQVWERKNEDIDHQ